MKKHVSTKEITKQFSIELISTIGKEMSEEYSKQRKIANLDSKSFNLGSLTFKFGAESETISESSIEKFLEHFEFKKGRCFFMLLLEDMSLTIGFDCDKKTNFRISSESEDQVWAEGITAVFYKLINDFKFDVTNSNLIESSKIIETTLKQLQNDESSNRYMKFFKKYLYQLIIAIAGAIIAGLILIYFKL